MILEPLAGEAVFYRYLILALIGVAAATFLALHFLTAPYGRHSRSGWGPTIHRTWGWVLMESPAVFMVLGLFVLSQRRTELVPAVFLVLWMTHYVNRTLIFPFRMRGGQLRMPLLIAGMGFFFNLMNGYIQARWLFALGPRLGPSWLADPRFVGGLVLFAGGFALNQHADSVLRNLRRPGEHGYKIPHGGAYRYVSCPNYLGELIEWSGWALLTWSPGGFVFLLWTAANLAPRARAHHRWYRETFPEYPQHRRALIPFVY